MPGRVALDIIFLPEPAIVARSYFVTAARARDLEEPMKQAIEQVLIPELSMNFASEGRPSAWAPLAEATEHRRLVYGTTFEKILQFSGDLLQSVTSLDSYEIIQAGATVEAILRDDTGYGHFHLTGRSYPPPMPVRDFVYVSDAGLDLIESIIFDWVTEGW